MKEIVYPQRLRETIVGKGNLSYIRTAHHGAPPPPPPPITCIPTIHKFNDNLMNFDLVSTVDVRYQFYTIIEISDGKRFFLRIEDDVIPLNSVISEAYDDDDQLVPMGVTAATVFTETLDNRNTSLSGFNEPFNSAYIDIDNAYYKFIQSIEYRYDISRWLIPQTHGVPITVINGISGLTQDSRIPNFAAEWGDRVDLRLNMDPYTFKFVHATPEDIQRYGIVNNGSRRCINIIDYINGGNELTLQSCALLDLPIDPNPDNVSSINCVNAPFEYEFGIQNMYNVPDLSGTLQVTDSVTGKSKKYIFKNIEQFMSYYITNFIQRTFPTYNIGPTAKMDQFLIRTLVPPEFRESYLHPLKIIIQMNSPNALFTNNGSNRLAFCLNLPPHGPGV